MASSVILTFLIHTKRSPNRRTIYLIFGYVVHTYGNTKHRAHRNQVRTDMAVRDCAVVSAPVIHNFIRRLERATFFTVATRSKPSARPRVVRSLPKLMGNFVGNSNRPTFCNLHYRAKTFYHIQTDHRARHFRTGNETGRITAATEVTKVSIRPSQRPA